MYSELSMISFSTRSPPVIPIYVLIIDHYLDFYSPGGSICHMHLNTVTISSIGDVIITFWIILDFNCWEIVKKQLTKCSNQVTYINTFLNLNIRFKNLFPVNTKHLYNICKRLDQRLRRLSNLLQMLYKSLVITGLSVRLTVVIWPEKNPCVLLDPVKPIVTPHSRGSIQAVKTLRSIISKCMT